MSTSTRRHRRRSSTRSPDHSVSPPRRRQRCRSRSPRRSLSPDYNTPLSPCLPRTPSPLSVQNNSFRPCKRVSNPTINTPPKYVLNRNVSTVVDLWREWSIGIGTGPPVSKLNEEYGSGWRAGWPTKERQYYSQRLAIIDLIYRRAGVGVDGQALRSCEEVARQLDVVREKLGLNGLANKIKKGGFGR